MNTDASLIEEVDNSGNVLARYTQSPEVDQPLAELRSGTTSYYQQDALNSVTSLSNGTGALANTYTYDAFGKLTASTGALTIHSSTQVASSIQRAACTIIVPVTTTKALAGSLAKTQSGSTAVLIFIAMFSITR